MAAGTVLSRVLGFVREFMMAALFGTSAAIDNWLMASVIPNLLFDAVNTALANVIVPVMAGNPGEATVDERTYVREMIGTVGLTAVGLTFVGELFTPPLLHVLAPGFGASALSQTVLLARIMMPTLVLWSGAGLAMGVLQAKGIYAPTAGAPIIVNVVRIATILTLGVMDGITGVAWGFLLAVGSQWIYLVAALHSQGFSLRPRFSVGHAWTRETLRLTGPLLIMTSTGTIGVIVDRILASNLPVGTIAALNYSLLLIQLPLGILVNSLVLPGFTRLSEEWNGRHVLEFRRLLARGLQVATIVAIPSLLFLLAERTAVIVLLYQRGAFTAQSTVMTAHLVPYWAVSIPAFAWGSLLGRAAFALKRTRPIMIISILTVAVNVGADLLLVRVLGGAGLALGTALATWTSTGLTWMYIGRRTGFESVGSRIKRRPLLLRYAVPAVLLVCIIPLLRAIGLTAVSTNPALTLVRVVLAGVIITSVWLGALSLCAQRRFSFRIGG